MDIKHIILELPNSNRKNFVKSQLTSYNLNSETIEAIWGSQLKESNLFVKPPQNYTLDSEERSWNHFACHLSWVKALQYAKRQKYDYFIVYEDDCLLTENYLQKINMVASELPEKWVLINLGPRENSNLELIQSKTYLANIKGVTTGMQSTLFNGKEIDRILYHLLDWKNWVQIMSPIITFPKFACYPPLTSQSVNLKSNIRI